MEILDFVISLDTLIELIQKVIGYIGDAKDADEDRKKILDEIASIYYLYSY